MYASPGPRRSNLRAPYWVGRGQARGSEAQNVRSWARVTRVYRKCRMMELGKTTNKRDERNGVLPCDESVVAQHARQSARAVRLRPLHAASQLYPSGYLPARLADQPARSQRLPNAAKSPAGAGAPPSRRPRPGLYDDAQPAAHSLARRTAYDTRAAIFAAPTCGVDA